MAVAAPIVEQIKELRLKLKTVKTSDDISQQLKDYRSFEQSLNDEKRVFYLFFAEYKAMCEIDGAVKESEYTVLFSEYAPRFDDIIDGADKGKPVDNRSILSLRSLNTRFNEAITKNWSSYLKKRIDNTYNTFFMFKDFVSDFEAVKRSRDHVYGSRPSTANIGDNIEKLIKICNSRIDQAGGSDDDIKAFIKKAGEGLATVEDLTHKILDWLRDKKFSHKIKIQM